MFRPAPMIHEASSTGSPRRCVHRLAMTCSLSGGISTANCTPFGGICQRTTGCFTKLHRSCGKNATHSPSCHPERPEGVEGSVPQVFPYERIPAIRQGFSLSSQYFSAIPSAAGPAFPPAPACKGPESDRAPRISPPPPQNRPRRRTRKTTDSRKHSRQPDPSP